MHIAENCFLFGVYHEGTCNTNENAGFQLLNINTDAFTKEIEVRHFLGDCKSFERYFPTLYNVTYDYGLLAITFRR